MEVNKVLYGDTVLIDLTEDTITADKIIEGYTAHDKSGVQIVGTNKSYPETPYLYDYNVGYIDNGTWIYENPTRTYTDIYLVESGHAYLIALGNTVGTRFRVMFTDTDVTTVTSGRVTGTKIYNINNPAHHSCAVYNASGDGYILIAKDNVGKTGLISYVYDITKMCI